MARPQKWTAEFWHYDCKPDRTRFQMEQKYQSEGTGIHANIMSALCESEYHFISLQTHADKKDFFERLMKNTDCGKVVDNLWIMCETGKIDKDLFLGYGVLFSESLKESLKEAYRGRSNPEPLTLQEVTEKVCETLKPVDDNFLDELRCFQHNNAEDSALSPLYYTRLDKTRLESSKGESENLHIIAEQSDGNDQEEEESAVAETPAVPDVPEKVVKEKADDRSEAEKELFRKAEKNFIDVSTEAMYDWGRERKALWKLIDRNAKLAKELDIEPLNLLRNIMRLFLELTNSNDKFYGEIMFLPSKLNAANVWQGVVKKWAKKNANLQPVKELIEAGIEIGSLM